MIASFGKLNAWRMAIELLIVYSVITLSGAVSDWSQQCGNCRCTWNSGKKSADCHNLSLLSVPNELSHDLQNLDLSDNVIAELRRNEFIEAGLRNLHKLTMRNCTIQEVHRDALHELSILIELDLSFNQIKVLHVGTFTGPIKLRLVLLNNNEIEQLDDGLFKNLQQLKKIDLRHNRIHRVGLRVFSAVPVLSDISLGENRLSVLRKETFQDIKNLTSLSLNLNPWNCTCQLQQFRDFAISRNLYTAPTECSEPPALRGRLWTDTKPEEFACKPRIVVPRAGASFDATTENVTLTCRIHGAPKPDISWIFNRRPINVYDPRLIVHSTVVASQRDASEMLVSELTIVGVRRIDHGTYTCRAENRGGHDEAEIVLAVGSSGFDSDAAMHATSSALIIVVTVVFVILLIVLVLVLLFCCYCRRTRKYMKNGSTSENGLVDMKIDKTQNESMLEGGSVIMEMQKSLLTEVNPVEKPPRRAEIESNGSSGDMDDMHDVNKTLLDETNFGSHDEETQSIALSDTTPRSRTTFVDDGYGTNLPPDLLAFPTRFQPSPSLQSSLSNIYDARLYIRSPVASPVYAPLTGNIYTAAPPGFRTLQHPKTGRTIAVANARSNSPFTAAPILYPPMIMKQGYVTIPRKPRTPSWAPSANSTMTDFGPSSPVAMSLEYTEPVYDNLGLRTTAAGNSVLNINKAVNAVAPSPAIRYTMKDRPLPATPAAATANANANANVNATPVGERDDPHYAAPPTAAQQQQQQQNSAVKVPPRPPPKPKKRSSVAVPDTSSLMSKSMFEDEGVDGTEV